MFGGYGGHDDEPQVDWVQVCYFQGRLGGLEAQSEGRFSLTCDMPFGDAGPLADPLIGGVYHRGQLIVGQRAFRHRHPPANDVGMAAGLSATSH